MGLWQKFEERAAVEEPSCREKGGQRNTVVLPEILKASLSLVIINV